MALNFHVSQTHPIKFRVRDDQDTRLSFRVEPGAVVQIGGTWYDGPYTVVPAAFAEQVLETADKVMREDVTVTEIPYFEVSNEKQGYTAVIAS